MIYRLPSAPRRGGGSCGGAQRRRSALTIGGLAMLASIVAGGPARALGGDISARPTLEQDGSCTAEAPHTVFRVDTSVDGTESNTGIHHMPGADDYDFAQILIVDPDDNVIGVQDELVVYGASEEHPFVVTVTRTPSAGPFRAILYDSSHGALVVDSEPRYSPGDVYTSHGAAQEVDVLEFDPSEIDPDCPGSPTPPGTLTLRAVTSPTAESGVRFRFLSDEPEFNGLQLTTSDGAASSAGIELPAGTYLLSYVRHVDWTLASISCAGDVDGGSTTDIANLSVSVDLDTGESIVCTFIFVSDDATLNEPTSRVIQSFMAQRADRILESAPRLTRRMSARENGARSGFRMNAADGRASASLDAGLAGLLAAGSTADHIRLDGAGGPRRAADDQGLDLWVQGAWYSVSDDRAGLADETEFGIVHVGADYRVKDWLLVGAMASFDWTDTSSPSLGSSISGEGWMAGPYAVARLGDGVFADVRAAFGASDNDVNPTGLYEDSFETDRYLVQASLAGDLGQGGWRLRPEAELAYFSEAQDAFTDSLGLQVPENTLDIVRLRAGAEVAYRFEGSRGGFVEPFAALRSVYDLQSTYVREADGRKNDFDSARAGLQAGVSTRFANGALVTAVVDVDGIGVSGFEASGARIVLSFPLQRGGRAVPAASSLAGDPSAARDPSRGPGKNPLNPLGRGG